MTPEWRWIDKVADVLLRSPGMENKTLDNMKKFIEGRPITYTRSSQSVGYEIVETHSIVL